MLVVIKAFRARWFCLLGHAVTLHMHHGPMQGDLLVFRFRPVPHH